MRISLFLSHDLNGPFVGYNNNFIKIRETDLFLRISQVVKRLFRIMANLFDTLKISCFFTQT